LSAKENKIGIDEFIFQLVKEYINVKYNKIDLNDFEIIESREKGLILDKKQLEELGYNQEGCCGVKAKSRRKKYEEILKNNKGCIESIFLGDDGVGKTSLIKRIDAKNFDEKEKHTDELNKYETKYTNSTMQVTLNIHDINNANKKNKSTEQIIINCQIYFLVYDLNNANSFDEIDFWIKVIKNCKKEKEKDDSVIVIIGNKKDLNNYENKSSINEDNNFDDLIDKGKKLANEIDAIFYTTTAKNDKEIKDIIGIAVEKYLNS
jgi:GTPase SAR1 family protein